MKIQRRQFLQWAGTSLLLGVSGSVRSATGPVSALTPEGEGNRMAILDEVRPISVAEYHRRLQQAQERMADHGFAALLLEPGTNMQYFTGMRFGRSERLIAAVIPVKGESFFVAPAFELGRFRNAEVVPDVVTWEEYESPYRRVFDGLRQRGVHSGVLGVGPTARLFVVQGLRDAGPNFEVKIGSEIVDPMRMRKSDHELRLMRAAIQVTEEAVRQTQRLAKPGMTEKELARELSKMFQQLGSRGGGLVQFAATAAVPHAGSGDRRLQEGDVVLIDCGTRVNGYGSDITRTAVFAKAPAKVKEVWRIVRNAQQAAIDFARPGVACEEVDAAARLVIEKAGYGKYFIHRLGHGLGMDGHERPYLVRGNKLRLEPGMTVTIEPGIYIPGEFGVRIEDDVVITETGCEPLSNLTTGLEVI